MGVSMTGILGNSLLSGREGKDLLVSTLERLKVQVVDTNCMFADKIGIPPSVATTAIKPEGTSSQLVGTSSGLHPWHSEYFIRTVRGGKDEPITQFMMDAGVPYEDDVMALDRRVVFSFPVKAPEGAVTREDLSALDHLELWKTYQEHYTEHKVSATINVKSEEWIDVGEWVWDNFDSISGVSFLPHDGGSYRQAPYTACSKEEYEEMVRTFPTDIDFSLLSSYEAEDNTVGSQTLSCTGAVCEVVDVGI